MKPRMLLILGVGLSALIGCGREDGKEKGKPEDKEAKVDHSTPEALVASYAACRKTGDMAAAADLLVPGGFYLLRVGDGHEGIHGDLPCPSSGLRPDFSGSVLEVPVDSPSFLHRAGIDLAGSDGGDAP